MKEELPSILISDGWVTDENDALVEVVIPPTVDKYNGPTKITFLGETFNWLPTGKSTMTEFECSCTSIQFNPQNGFNGATNFTTFSAPNCTNITVYNSGNSLCNPFANSGLSTVNLPNLESFAHSNWVTSGDVRGLFTNCGSLSSLSLPKLKTVSTQGRNTVSGLPCYAVFCGSCTNLTSLSLPLLESINTSSGGYFLSNCTSLQSLTLESLTTVSTGGELFKLCTSLTTVVFPKIQSIIKSGNGMFYECTSLTSVTLGSEGHPVPGIPAGTFQNCTQSGLTITIYTEGGASLSGEKWGATNATIVYETA